MNAEEEKNDIWNASYNCYCILLCMIAAGEVLSVAEQFLEQQMHPTVIIAAYRQALEDSLEVLRTKVW